MFDVIYNDIRGLDAGVLVKQRPGIPAPILEQEEIVIPGRDGVLLSAEKRYSPIEISVEFNFMASHPDLWGHDFRRFKRWLRGAGILRFTDDPDVHWRCFRADILTTERTSRRIGSAEVVFHCQPWTYFNSGDIFRAVSACKYNAYDTALPVYYITASSSAELWRLTVNGNVMTGTQSCYIDTEMQTATDLDGNQINNTVTGDYLGLALLEGENEINISGGSLRVKPRWRAV